MPGPAPLFKVSTVYANPFEFDTILIQYPSCLSPVQTRSPGGYKVNLDLPLWIESGNLCPSTNISFSAVWQPACQVHCCFSCIWDGFICIFREWNLSDADICPWKWGICICSGAAPINNEISTGKFRKFGETRLFPLCVEYLCIFNTIKSEVANLSYINWRSTKIKVVKYQINSPTLLELIRIIVVMK